MRKEVVVLAAVTTVSTVVAAALLVRQWKRRSEQRWRHAQRILRKFARECATPVPKLWQIADDLVTEMQAGLTSSESSLQMLPSCLASLPTGDEKGLYYGINLRGTNFIIVQARLGGRNEPPVSRLAGRNEPISDLYRQEIQIPPNIIEGSSQELFDWITVELGKFISMHSEGLQGGEKNVGFTVSPTIAEVAASKETAIKWKDSLFGDAEGNKLLNEINLALEKHGVDKQVFALVDDTIGVLAGGRYYSKESVAAVTLGMGTNAVYVESAKSVEKWPDQAPKPEEIAINIKWGNFSSSHLPITEFDTSLDAESSYPGSQIFEKLISGTYLGETVRRVLLKMAQESSLFGDRVPPKLAITYSLRSPDMAAMHQDTSEDYEVIDEKLTEIFGITNSTTMARELVAEVCDVVAERGARLVGAGIVGIVKKLGRLSNRISIITVEGGVYEHYRVFRNYLHSSVWEMLGNELSDNVIIEHSHGGSGASSIFIAASQP
ncbi:probable hexokinase-like 2 protein [Nicotiana tomentosiformis]|uniref:Phosphotransferase n=1 Tax=Nicotiana tabacum TaxID=4097 RepID=A0A1S4CK38_TOBAC|nr:probable hexokinase-like 2 protein [Nicotiana tomentosiformis]XP_016501284.1 PREDICTED: probable hexokinase-like 2 protein [Nicotiana tabacum]